jgi:hypothetical protein
MSLAGGPAEFSAAQYFVVVINQDADTDDSVDSGSILINSVKAVEDWCTRDRPHARKVVKSMARD